MRFMADLAQVKSETKIGQRSKADANKLFDKYLKEAKYADYKDQIYFAKAELAFEQNQMTEGEEFLRKSVANNEKDKNLKTEVYLKLAEINYQKENYEQSKLFYDSTLLVMPKNDPRRFQTKNLADNLKEIYENTKMIALQDSLLKLGELPRAELETIAKKLLAEEIKSGKKASDEKAFNNSNLFVQNRPAGGLSTFFAYNTSAIESGKKDFTRKWGNRKLEDNWRRSNKNAGGEITIDNPTEAGPKDELDDIILTDADFKRLMGAVPLTLGQKDKSSQALRKAYLELGKLYREKVQNYAKSIQTLEELDRKFPNHEDQAEAYYYMYLSYLDLDRNAEAEAIKNKIIQNHQGSKFAKLLQDPSYVQSLLSERKRIDNYYDQTLGLFEKKQYTEAKDRCQKSTELFSPQNKYASKFYLLYAMCQGAIEGKESYMKALNEVKIRYPNTPEDSRAGEILRFLNGDKSALTVSTPVDVQNIYEREDEKKHVIAIVIQTNSDSIVQLAKISISNYNKKYQKLKKLQLTDATLSSVENTHVITIKTFSNRTEASKYHEGIMNSLNEFLDRKFGAFEVFPVSQTNFRKMTLEKTHKTYVSWMEKEFQGKK